MSEETDARRARRARRDRWVARVGAVLLRLLATTWRLRYVNRAPALELTARGRSFIYAFWHGEQLSLLWAFRKTGTAILISEHGDGEIVARAAISLGYNTVRGSSSRSADRALLQLSRELESGRDIAVTPDGPRGPRHSFAPGALIAAHRAGAPLVPLRSFASRAWRLKSWDQFEIPKPFARVTVVMGDPVFVQAPSARDAAAQTDKFAALISSLELPSNG